jgi:hypothetical protein
MYNKHITQTWQKLVLIKFYDQSEKLLEFRKCFRENFENFLKKKESEENELRSKQEKEMQEANLKNLQLELIVNRHISELNKFSREYKEKYTLFKIEWKDNYLRTIEDSFQNFFESLDQASIIYNRDNKIVQIKFNPLVQKNSLSFNNSFLDKTDKKSGKSVKSTKSNELKKADSKTNFSVNLSAIKDKNLIFHQRINFGLFNKNRLNLYTIKVNDHIENNIKQIYSELIFKDLKNKFGAALNSNNMINNVINSTQNDSEEMSINDILRYSDTFGENILAMMNFFTYDKAEMKIVHLLESLDQNVNVTSLSQFENELFFDNFMKTFNILEEKCSKGILPSEFDFFITNHEGIQSFDILINIFVSKEKLNEDDLLSGKNYFYHIILVFKIIIYFVNIYKINILILPLEKIIDKFFKINRFSDFKNFSKCKRIIINQIKISMISVIKSGM